MYQPLRPLGRIHLNLATFQATLSRQWQRNAILLTAVILAALGYATWQHSPGLLLLSSRGSPKIHYSPLTEKFDPGVSSCPITFLNSSRYPHAVCLDGSPPAYHLRRGSGSGADSWLIFLEGGSWCKTLRECQNRAGMALGSSEFVRSHFAFQGILSNSSAANPDFYNWNMVYVKYCDGASFAGNVGQPVGSAEHAIHFRGKAVFRAVISELLTSGMQRADRAILGGCSAGGLAALLNCDDFAAQIAGVKSDSPTGGTMAATSGTVRVKCLADGGFFLDATDVAGTRSLRRMFQGVVKLQNVTLPSACVAAHSQKDRWKCFFPEHIIPHIATPVFVVNPFYDVWQISNVFVPPPSDRRGAWMHCKSNESLCSPQQITVLNGYRERMVEALTPVARSDGHGAFVNSCFIHCQAPWASTWHSPRAPRINNKTMAEAVGAWFFERAAAKFLDCPYPCNPTCYKWKE